jgi:hypothetical protein
MHLPRGIVLFLGGMVVVFGVFRIVLGLRSAPAPPQHPDVELDEPRRSGLVGLGRTHNLLVGVIFVILGVILSLQAFGIKPPWNR